jgi:2-methylisocitrate lyase-like PEP mutase family enzyme
MKLREAILSDEVLIAPGAHDALSAKMVEMMGFKLVYMTGFGVSASMNGMPDVGLISFEEMLWMLRRIVNAVNIPVIADADTGYGNAVNVIRTVKEYIRAGAAGLHIEDQVFPKRCGHVEGKEVIPCEEMVGKISAAIDTRNTLNRDFLVIARTDALNVEGLEKTLERLDLYAEAGADMLFVDGIKTVEEAEYFGKNARKPLVYNMGGLAPKLSITELRKLGNYKLVILPTYMLRVAVDAMRKLLERIRREGIQIVKSPEIMDSKTFYEFIGFPKIRELEEKYLPPQTIRKKYGNL